MKAKELPYFRVGCHEWHYLQEEELKFIDKTELIPDLVTGQRLAFFAHPRRFGKTTLVDLLSELFAHGDGTFHGTAVFGRWPERVRYPVIKLNFLMFNCDSLQEAEQDLCIELYYAFRGALRAWDVWVPKELERTNFAEQCAVIEEYLGARQVVFLIDEWDHPMTSHMLEPEKAAIAEAALTRFYAWIARCPNTHFAFVTGISSYHSAAIAPDFTNLSLDPHYATLVGLTPEELELSLGDYIVEAARREQDKTPDDIRAEVKSEYLGFCFEASGQIKLYNTWDIVNYFHHIGGQRDEWGVDRGSHWINSSYAWVALKESLKREPFDLGAIMRAYDDEVALTAAELQAFMHDAPWTLNTLFHQTGFYTIKGSDADGSYRLGFPNDEVRWCFNYVLREVIHGNDILHYREDNPAGPLKRSAQKTFGQGDFTQFCALVNQLLRRTFFKYLQPQGLYRNLLAFWLRTQSTAFRVHLGSELNELEVTYQGQRYRIAIHEVERAQLERDLSTEPASADCTHLELQVDPELKQIVAFKLLTGQATLGQAVAPAPEVEDLSEE